MCVSVKENDWKNNFRVHVKVWVQSKTSAQEEQRETRVVGQVKEQYKWKKERETCY